MKLSIEETILNVYVSYESQLKLNSDIRLSNIRLIVIRHYSLLINRDINASKNILHFLYNYLNNLERPSWLIK